MFLFTISDGIFIWTTFIYIGSDPLEHRFCVGWSGLAFFDWSGRTNKKRDLHHNIICPSESGRVITLLMALVKNRTWASVFWLSDDWNAGTNRCAMSATTAFKFYAVRRMETQPRSSREVADGPPWKRGYWLISHWWWWTKESRRIYSTSTTQKYIERYILIKEKVPKNWQVQ